MYRYLGDTGISLYDLLSVLMFLPILIFNLSQFKRKKLILSKKTISIINDSGKITRKTRTENSYILLEIIIISLLQYALIPIGNKVLGNLLKTGPNYFGLLFIGPVILTIVFIFSGTDVLKHIDLITPAYPLGLIVAKLACFCYGCCYGIECSFGLYNHFTKAVEFPVQLVEAGLGLILFVFLMFIRRKTKEGTLFPIYLITYSATRFFSEFLRHEADVLWIFKRYHLFCLAGIVVGVIELYLVTKKKNKLILDSDTLKKHLYEYAVKNGIIKNKNIVHHKKRRKK